MPASGPVSIRSSPISRLTRVDLPAFGRPTMAIRRGAAPFSASSSASTTGRAMASIASKKVRQLPSPCSAEIATGSPKPRVKASRAPASPARPSALLATRITGLPRRCSSSPKIRSIGVTPSRASKTNRARSASSSASSVWRRMRASRLSSVTSSKPAVSISSRSRSPSRLRCAKRAVAGDAPAGRPPAPGLRPASRLNRVDLPIPLGRPTMASFTTAGRVRLYAQGHWIAISSAVWVTT